MPPVFLKFLVSFAKALALTPTFLAKTVFFIPLSINNLNRLLQSSLYDSYVPVPFRIVPGCTGGLSEFCLFMVFSFHYFSMGNFLYQAFPPGIRANLSMVIVPGTSSKAARALTVEILVTRHIFIHWGIEKRLSIQAALLL